MAGTAWSFAGTSFYILHRDGIIDTPSGREWTVHEAPGVDGISAKRPGRRLTQKYRLTALALTPAAYLNLKALFAAASDGTLKRPIDGDHWVYADAFVSQQGEWRETVEDGHYTCEVEFSCPSSPTLESTGDKVAGL